MLNSVNHVEKINILTRERAKITSYLEIGEPDKQFFTSYIFITSNDTFKKCIESRKVYFEV